MYVCVWYVSKSLTNFSKYSRIWESMEFFTSSKQIMWLSWQETIVFTFYSSHQHSTENQIDTFILKILEWRLQCWLPCLGLILIFFFFKWLLAKKVKPFKPSNENLTFLVNLNQPSCFFPLCPFYIL